MDGKWYVGVTHAHTTASDGRLSCEELIALAKKNKLDFLMITDHNKCCSELPKTDGITVIYGAEMTYHGGHANVWGVRDAVDDFECSSYDQWIEKKSEAQRRGALICMNHPWCNQCPWRWDKDISQVDVLEVWNAPMHYDNLTCTAWWHEQMKNGHKTPIVGGSDYHCDFLITNLLVNPVTYVFAQSNSAQDILAAIAAGHTTVSPGVEKTFIELSCGDAIMGDTVKLADTGEGVTVKVKKLKKKHRLMVFNQDGECFSFVAPKTGDFCVRIPVSKPGFMCAHVEKTLSRAYKAAYRQVITRKVPEQKYMPLPPFIYAQSGAMFFE